MTAWLHDLNFLSCSLFSQTLHLTPPTQPSQPLISMMGTVVPAAPPLTGNVDPSKIEEIRRTVYVGNLNSSVRNNFGRTIMSVTYKYVYGSYLVSTDVTPVLNIIIIYK